MTRFGLNPHGMVFTKDQVLRCLPVLGRIIPRDYPTLVSLYDATLERRFGGLPLDQDASYEEIQKHEEYYQSLTPTVIFARMCKQEQISDELIDSLRTMTQEDRDEIKRQAKDFKPRANRPVGGIKVKYQPTIRYNESVLRVLRWIDSLLSAISKIERNEQEKLLAFAMGSHGRLGKNSIVHQLDPDILPHFGRQGTRCLCNTCGKYVM
jgi:uncharacterized protein (DUF4415 family)